jgi:hypothetical protein
MVVKTFDKDVNTNRLTTEITAIGIIPINIVAQPNKVIIYFENELSEEENVSLNTIVDNHILNLVNEDLLTIELLHKYGNKTLQKDYLYIRQLIIELLNTKTWNNCTNAEKDIVIELHARETSKTSIVANGEKVTYLMSKKGKNQAQAILFLQEQFAIHHIKEIQSCTARANSKDLFTIIPKYLTILDAGDFIRTISSLFTAYLFQGVKGVNDSDAGEGLFDFIESTVGTSFETAGLREQGYVMQNGDANMDNFINALMDILRNGNYN